MLPAIFKTSNFYTMADETKFPSELTPEEQTPQAKKARQAQADQMYGNAIYHAPDVLQRADFIDGKPPLGAPVAQGPNLSKEETEFAAASAANKNAEEVPEEKIPAPVQASEEPLAEAGKAVAAKKTAAPKKGK